VTVPLFVLALLAAISLGSTWLLQQLHTDEEKLEVLQPDAYALEAHSLSRFSQPDGAPGLTLLTSPSPRVSLPALRSIAHLQTLQVTSFWHVLGFLGVAVVGFGLSFCIGVNKFSMHALYRNRLIRAYLGASRLFRDPDLFTGFDENDKSIPAPAPSEAPAVSRHTGLRHMIYYAFKVDPSLPVDEVQGTIPQALLMMNSVLVNTYVAGSGKTFLAEAFDKKMGDDDILLGLYERTLARRPAPEELKICQSYLQKVNNRKEALEDVFWSLINSTEFLTKR